MAAMLALLVESCRTSFGQHILSIFFCSINSVSCEMPWFPHKKNTSIL
jgi:hypothetical protein